MADELDELGEAFRRQHEHVVKSHAVNRVGWTRQQYLEDAKRLMGDLDGSVCDLVNGHVTAMLAEITRLRAEVAGLSIWQENASAKLYQLTSPPDDAEVERAARAMHAADGYTDWDTEYQGTKVHYRRRARAALTAARGEA